MENRVTDPEVLKQLEEEARFIESLLGIDSTNYQNIINNSPIQVEINSTQEDIPLINKPIILQEDSDLVLNRDGEYVVYNSNMVYIEHRGYYVEESESIYLQLESVDEDIDKVISAIEIVELDEDEWEERIVEISENYSDQINTVDGITYLDEDSAIRAGYKFIEGFWKKEEITNINNYFDKYSLGFYKDLEESLNNFYPNNWWFQKMKYTFDFENYTRKYKGSLAIFEKYEYVLVIKFPYIEITNSNKSKHIIEDLYIVLPFQENGTTSSLIYGFRGKLTNIEFNNTYYHSHLPNSYEYTINKFCLGSGPLVQILYKMFKEFDKDNFTYFLANLSVYVDWESLDGGPHRSIESSVIKNNNVIINYNIDQSSLNNKVIENINNGLLSILIEYNSSTKLLDIKYNELEKSLSIMLNNNINYNSSYCYKDEELNQYFTITQNIVDRQISFLDPLCRLGDKEIFFELKKIENKNTNYLKVIHPNITHYVKRYLIRRINEYYLQENKS